MESGCIRNLIYLYSFMISVVLILNLQRHILKPFSVLYNYVFKNLLNYQTCTIILCWFAISAFIIYTEYNFFNYE